MTTVAIKYDAILSDILRIVTISNQLQIAVNPDQLIQPYANFYTKAYLLMICVYLESYVKEVTTSYINHFNQEILRIGIPRNLVLWSVDRKGNKGLDQKFEEFKIDLDQADIDNVVSPNPHLIIGLFNRLGFDVDKDPKINAMKGVIYPIVDLRNRIVHYNDSASTITFVDILRYIQDFKKFISLLDSVIEAKLSPMGVLL